MTVSVIVAYTLDGGEVSAYDFGFDMQDEQLTDFASEIAAIDKEEGSSTAIHHTFVVLPDYIKEGDSWESEEALKALIKVLAGALT